MAQLRSFGVESPDFTALAQQAALVSCLYQNDRVRAEQLLGTDGTILAWVFREDSWPPSYCVIQSGAGRYFVVVAGTTNIRQVVGHVNGTFWRRYNGPAQLANGQWLDVSETLGAEVRSALPSDLGGATVHLSGHSYGGAVALPVAIDTRVSLGTPSVQLMTIGAPKAFSDRYNGVLPTPYYRFASNRDVVSYLPPSGSDAGVDVWNNPVLWLVAPVDWQHYGEGRYLNWNGVYDDTTPPPDPLPTGVSVSPVGEHLLRNYWGRLRQRSLNVGTTADADAALAIMDATLTGPPAQVIAPELPRVVRRPVTGVRDLVIPYYFGPPSTPSLVGVPTMAVPTSLPAGNKTMKITQIFNADRQGWSESYLLNCAANADGFQLGEAYAQALNLARTPVMPQDYVIEAVRISDADVNRDADLVEEPNLFLGEGAIQTDPAPPERGWQILIADATRQVRATRIFRGWPASLVPYNVKGGAFNPNPPQKVTDWVRAMRPLLTQTFTYQNVITGTPCMRTYDRTTGNAPVLPVSQFLVNTNGFLTAKLVATSTTLVVGDIVQVGAVRKKCLKGLTGLGRVISVLTDAGNPVITLDKKLCCGVDQLSGVLGTIQKRTKAYVAIETATLGHTAKKDVGRAFFVTAGARKARCC